MTEQEKMYAYWLCNAPGIGDKGIARLLSCCGSPEKVYEGTEEIWKQAVKPKLAEGLREHRKSWKLKEEYAYLTEQGIGFVLQEEKEYPERLRQIPDPPYALFYRGRLPEPDHLAVAVIGARDCSEYGSLVAEKLGQFLGKQGIPVISGMARGIDGISQEAALRAGGTSFGVLGNGVDICYPRQNEGLYQKLLEKGGILSTYPPKTPPRPQNFPPRNRIVSGLADAIVVIEARHKSGTLITVDMALEQGREVYVVPGRITDRLSDGCNQLLRQGAGVMLSPEILLTELWDMWAKRRPLSEKAGDLPDIEETVQASPEASLPENLAQVYGALDLCSCSLEQIKARLQNPMDITSLNIALMQLCLRGCAVQKTPGYFSRKEC